ncbi:MAG: YciI family protein [Oscillospiraceae bacterium]|nr:YciI family protein [Oscillospiraceae bacterium]
MKFFIVEGISDVSSLSEEEFQALRQAHSAYLAKAFEDGRILFSGPKVGGGGGFTIFKAESEEATKQFFEGDPFFKAGVETYTPREFKISRCQPTVEDWFQA